MVSINVSWSSGMQKAESYAVSAEGFGICDVSRTGF